MHRDDRISFDSLQADLIHPIQAQLDELPRKSAAFARLGIGIPVALRLNKVKDCRHDGHEENRFFVQGPSAMAC